MGSDLEFLVSVSLTGTSPPIFRNIQTKNGYNLCTICPNNKLELYQNAFLCLGYCFPRYKFQVVLEVEKNLN